MWSIYLSGRFEIRLRASSSISSRSPNRKASAGQALTHAGTAIFAPKELPSSALSLCPFLDKGSGCSDRSAQCVHFCILGASECHSAVGTPQGQAQMQYRHPMHLLASYVTEPSGCLFRAVVGQADAHAGSKQWRQRCMVKM